LWLTIAAYAQDDKKQAEQWPVEVKLSLLVTDSAGKPVNNISARDIKLFEDDVEQKITSLTKAPVSNVAFVMDNTGSMGTQLPVEVALASTIADNLDGAEAMVIRFVSNDKITIDQTWTTDKGKLKKTFANMFIEGGQSAVRDAIYLAAQKLIDESKTKKDKRFAIILVSDGEDRNSYYSEKDLFSLLRGSDVQIFILGLTAQLDVDSGFIRVSPRERSEEFLHRLADRSGGSAYILNGKYKKEDLIAAVTGLINELRSPFVISYTSSNQNHNGKIRKLRVEVTDVPNGEKRTGVVKSSFVVPKNP
jgi:Ca-activated chloride channel family protein